MSILGKSSRVFQNFFNRSVAGENAAQSVLAQRHHSELDRLLFEHNRGRALIDQFANRIGDLHQFINAFAAFVTGVVAGVAAFPVKELAVANFAPRKFQLREHGLVRLISGPAIRTNAAQSGPHDSGILFTAFAWPRADSRESGGDQSPLRRGGSNCRSALYFEPAMGAVLMA